MFNFPNSPVYGQVFNPSPDVFYVWDGTVWKQSGSDTTSDLLNGQPGPYYLDRANHTGMQGIGTIAGLQDELADKAPLFHGHAISDVTGLQPALDGKAPTVHAHVASDVTDFAEAVDDRVASLVVAGANITSTYDDVANTLTIASTASGGGGIADAPDAQNYVRTLGSWVLGYTKAAIDTLLGGKANSTHTHAESDVTNLVTDLAGKASSIHTHAESDVTNLVTDLAARVLKAGDIMTGPLNVNHASGIATYGPVYSGGTVTSSTYFAASGASVSLTTTGAGTVYLQPNGAGSGVGLWTLNSSGVFSGPTLTASGSVSGLNLFGGTFSATGASIGTQISNSNNVYASSANIATVAQQIRLFNPNGQVGNINTNGSATAYVTSSDANMKQLDHEYDPAEAIAIIKADPVLAFTWKNTGEAAIGWFAQKSHAIHPNLAQPPPEPEEGEAKPAFGDDNYAPWGIDYGRRTPYLWAALANALERIEQLEARLSLIEPKP